eukprot:4764392-Amphidinium_carterae.1
MCRLKRSCSPFLRTCSLRETRRLSSKGRIASYRRAFIRHDAPCFLINVVCCGAYVKMHSRFAMG